jgi:transposase InsO family protein
VDLVRFVLEEHLRTKRPLPELARSYEIDKSWLYKRLKRYRLEGDLEARSRRPARSPTRLADLYEDEIVAIRKRLEGSGFDHGPYSIQSELLLSHEKVPSVSTIYRVLKARGFVSPEPHKRPKSSYVRFVAELPNEVWQADVTHVAMADGSFMEVLNIIDDHSRVCIASKVFLSTRSVDVVRTLHQAAATWGYPQSLLTDNGAIFTASHRGGEAALETECLSLGIKTKHSRPYHPQTCGKVERFHQTEKKFLFKQDKPATKKQLQGQLNRFSDYYNNLRPHRGIGRARPIEAFSARSKATPNGPKIEAGGYRVRRDKVDRWGRITIRHRSKLHHVGIGNRFAGERVIVLIAGRDIKVLSIDGVAIRHFLLDPEHDYQRIP